MLRIRVITVLYVRRQFGTEEQLPWKLRLENSYAQLSYKLYYYADAEQSALEIRTSFFSFFIGYTYIVANGSSCCFFLTGLERLVLSSWKALCGKLRDCFTRYTNLKLSRNVGKFYARQVVSDDRAAKPKFAAF